MRSRTLLLGLLLISIPHCTDNVASPSSPEWQTVSQHLPAALLSIAGTSDEDIWAVGADKDALGPSVLRFDGKSWSRVATGQHGDLWWVNPLADGTTFMSGAGGMILRHKGGVFERMKTPGLAKDTVFGVWGASATDAYAVGGWAGHNGFLWHYDGSQWLNVRLPDDLPRLADGGVSGLFKVWGTGPKDVWVTGGSGIVLHGNAADGFRVVPSATSDTLFTVHGNTNGAVTIVGGASTGLALDPSKEALRNTAPVGSPLLQGIFVENNGDAWAVGEKASVYRRAKETWIAVDTRQSLDIQSLHATWVDPKGGMWAVGGDVLSATLNNGAIVHFGAPVSGYLPPAPDGGVESGSVDAAVAPLAVCPTETLRAGEGKSIARRWDEQILAAIRLDLPRPPVHARNLFHLSAAMWDAWATYDATSDGYFVTEKNAATDIDSARREAISYAAYGILKHRYEKAIGGATSAACFRALMSNLGYDPSDLHTNGQDARAIGNRIAASVLSATKDDGSNESANYADVTFKSDNPPLVMDRSGTPSGTNPNLWQPLNLSVAATQNGIILPAGAQTYVGSQWGNVRPFALGKSDPQGPWKDAGPAPTLADPSMKKWVAEVVEKAAGYAPTDNVKIDISPASLGGNSLGTNDGKGYGLNPATSLPYASTPVLRADFGRVLAEYWADGPKSETPPGHWNAISNRASDHPSLVRKIGGTGPTVDPLEWDVKVYFTLNGAVHDAACAAWDIKRRSLAGRPSTYIRYMGGKGQSSDPNAPMYHPEGLPLVEGLIEPITLESTKPGGKHAHLNLYVGQIAVRTWRGEPGDRAHEIGGVGWLRAVDWWPYQRRTFVTPPFPGFISGHSTFSRSAAEVLAGFSGTPYFPGGLGTTTVNPGFLSFEHGPSVPIELQWATYYDAADQAGQSRIWGGIHIEPDDFAGRKVGSEVGKGALAKAQTYFDGSAIP
ncbi:MAG: hypothetical protein KBF88_04495 [Polyangiaceae bacterium]|nr:hypothetical protein [Polyangiaceae bacterium]